ncbi:MAG: benzoate-CoA ligase family protein [Burkholderiaceae bacterium]
MPANPPPAQFNFAAHLLQLNSSRHSKVAYRDDQRTLTYGELAERVRRFASVLTALGIRREERMLLLMHDSVDWPVAFLGCLYAGVVPVALNTLLSAGDYAYVLAHSRAQAALISNALAPTLSQAMQAETHEIRHAIDVDSLHELIAQAQPATAPAPTAADDIGFWLYSSGSTGRPKGTVHTHANLYWTAELYGKPVLGIRDSDVVFSAAKLFFAYGLGNALTFPLSVGASVVLMAERPTPQAVFARLVEHRPTIFFGVPTLYAAMLAAPDLPAPDKVNLRVAVSAGEALPKEIGERFAAQFRCDVLDGIGSTELLHIFLSNRPGAVRYGTTGTPVPGYQIELRDEHGIPVGADAIGDLYVNGPSAALMYWTQREQSRSTFIGQWTKSGDKYMRSEDGFFTYCGRGDDMLRVSGQYVSPFEVEAMLMQHPSVLEAAVVGRLDSDGLTKTKAFVVLKGDARGSPALEDELKAFVRGKLAPHKYPRSIEFIGELPKTATGKIQRFKLREKDAGLG